MKTEITFEDYLKKGNLSENTIESYLWTVNYFTTNYEKVSKENLLAYKGYLMEHFKPKTVNLRIQAINKYLEYLEKSQLRLKAVKIQQKSFLENVISNADYKFLKNQLKKDGNLEWYFVVWYLAATGARVSELIRIKIEHVQLGYFDLYSNPDKFLLRVLYSFLPDDSAILCKISLIQHHFLILIHPNDNLPVSASLHRFPLPF